jgi:serine/threonine protein phosphatase PrpC
MEHVMKRIREIIKQRAYDKWGDCKLDKSQSFLQDLSQILVDSIKQCDSEFLLANAKYALESGACLLILLIIGKFVITANLGNCKAFLFTQGQVIRLSTDHYPVKTKRKSILCPEICVCFKTEPKG